MKLDQHKRQLLHEEKVHENTSNSHTTSHSIVQKITRRMSEISSQSCLVQAHARMTSLGPTWSGTVKILLLGAAGGAKIQLTMKHQQCMETSKTSLSVSASNF